MSESSRATRSGFSGADQIEFGRVDLFDLLDSMNRSDWANLAVPVNFRTGMVLIPSTDVASANNGPGRV